MKSLLFLSFLTLPAIGETVPDKLANTVILDPVAVKNLGIETTEAEEAAFEETVFALGRIAVLPGKSAVVSSRIPGRIHSLLARPHVPVTQGDELLWIESRQPGDPPPVIMIEAPLTGLIAEVHVSAGQPVTPDTSLLEIVDLETVEAAAAIPEGSAGKIQPGQKARIRVPAAGDMVFEAAIVHLGAAVDPATGTLEAAFHVPNPEGRLRPGMRAEFSLVTNLREGVMTIPRQALQGDSTNRFVFVKDYELPEAFVKTAIVTGAVNDQSVEVLSGLLPGDEVVTKGSYSLAFAGKGSVSLKEALDAAHGHPHNEDGSEMTKEQLAALGSGADSGHSHHHGPFDAPLTKLFAATTGLLLALLIAAQYKNRKGAENAAEI
jgi:cobalt-zinc-cadmium efflux system membrane fusion protein